MIRLILAEDHTLVRAGVRQLLEQVDDIEVVGETADGAEASCMIVDLKPDLALLDLQLPNMTGIQVTRWLREHGHNIPILILTAFDDDPYILALFKAGANGYVSKTAKPTYLLQAVRDVLQGKTVLDPAIASRLMIRMAQEPVRETQYQPLTDREMEVLTLAAQGLTNRAIGLKLGISNRTVQVHLAHVFRKLDSNGRTQAVLRAVALGLIDAELVEQ